ncbi:MAG: hypothetical protein FWF75_04130, partial [Propionibacteriaceae bacterium]|nr:hypothetical protein [Propionibacteriaceae bacterium]
AAAVPAPAGVLAHDVRAIRAEGGAQVMPDPYESLDIACHCRGVHPGRPEGVRGCGIIFRVEIERRALS